MNKSGTTKRGAAVLVVAVAAASPLLAGCDFGAFARGAEKAAPYVDDAARAAEREKAALEWVERGKTGGEVVERVCASPIDCPGENDGS